MVCILLQEGNTPLHLACESGLISCVEVYTYLTLTPLSLSLSLHTPLTHLLTLFSFQLLLDAHGDLKIKNDNGKTPVDLASEAGYEELAKNLETRLVFDVSERERERRPIYKTNLHIAHPK